MAIEEMGKREWSQSGLARSADLKRAVIGKLLYGHANPRPATLEAIARMLKIPVAGIFRIAADQSPWFRGGRGA